MRACIAVLAGNNHQPLLTAHLPTCSRSDKKPIVWTLRSKKRRKRLGSTRTKIAISRLSIQKAKERTQSWTSPTGRRLRKSCASITVRLLPHPLSLVRFECADPDSVQDERVDPSALCPFCDQPLPTDPSQRLVSLQQYLLERPHIESRYSARNPNAKYLPIVEIASFCQLHKVERTIIPEGIEKGYPMVIDWKALPRSVNLVSFPRGLQQ